MRLDKFILDANIFITPYRSYYPFDLARGFWEQMEKCLKRENVILLDCGSSNDYGCNDHHYGSKVRSH